MNQISEEAKHILKELGVSEDEIDSTCSINEHVDGVNDLTPRTLHGQTARVEVQKENIRHRSVALLACKGLTYKEIAQATGYSPVHIGTLMKQEWMQDLVTGILEKAGGDPIRNLLAATATQSVMTLINLRDTAESETVRRASASDLLDRHLGKAPQHIRTEQIASTDAVTEAERLKREIAEELAKLDEQKTQ